MRWFRRKSAQRSARQLTDQQQAIVDEARQRFGMHQPGTFDQQAAGVANLLTGPDGIEAAAAVIHEFADAAHQEIQRLTADLSARVRYNFVVDRTNYRTLWREAQPDLPWPLFNLPGSLFPYIHVAAAAQVINTHAKQTTDQDQLLAHLFEILDLTIAGWEYANVRVDTNGATLATTLITTTRTLRDAMSKEPPLPPPVRELMRNNNSIPVHAPDAPQVVDSFNPGKQLREVLLV